MNKITNPTSPALERSSILPTTRQRPTTVVTTNTISTQTLGPESSSPESNPNSPSWRQTIFSLVTPRSRLNSPHREQVEALEHDSKTACGSLSSEDVIKYLQLTPEQQQHYNEHKPADRKLYLLLSTIEREECSKWKDVDVRCLYLNLEPAVKLQYRDYAALLQSKLTGEPERVHLAKGRINDQLKLFLSRSKETREKIVQEGRLFAIVKDDIGEAKKWKMDTAERARQFCKTSAYAAHLRTFLENSGNDAHAIEELGGLMLLADLIQNNDFHSIAQVEKWIQENS